MTKSAESHSVVIISGARFVVYRPKALDQDPTLALWLFVVLTQVQVFLSVFATGFPAIMRTALAMSTNVDSSEDTSQGQSRSDSSFVLGSLKRGGKQIRKQASHASFAPYVGGGGRANISSVKAAPNAGPEDDSSQRGILKHDEFDISIETVGSRR